MNTQKQLNSTPPNRPQRVAVKKMQTAHQHKKLPPSEPQTKDNMIFEFPNPSSIPGGQTPPVSAWVMRGRPSGFLGNPLSLDLLFLLDHAKRKIKTKVIRRYRIRVSVLRTQHSNKTILLIPVIPPVRRSRPSATPQVVRPSRPTKGTARPSATPQVVRPSGPTEGTARPSVSPKANGRQSSHHNITT